MTGDDVRPRSIPPKFDADPIKNNDAAPTTSGDKLPNYNTPDALQQRPTAPPPPKFAAPPPSMPTSRLTQDSAKAAALAAAKAAQHATPAQRERMVMEAAAQALAQRAAATNTDPSQPPAIPPGAPAVPKPPPGPYHPPSWTSIPENIPYTMEVMKQGTIVSVLDLRQLSIDAGRGHLSLGRAPDNDILLDHPSSSRLHATLEFREEDGAVFLYDPGSTHGCYVNKARIAAGEHVALHVGDMIRFGESSRMHILCGPMELMAEEGPSREERRQATALEALRRRKEIDAAAAEAAMARAIAGGGVGVSGTVSWGFGEDARDEEDLRTTGRDLHEIDWRSHAANRGLTEKQQKIADKIRKRELRITHLQRESEKIQVKQKSMEELSVGQANTLARNEEEIEKAMVEMEELEDQLVESIRDSLGGQKKGGRTGKKKGGASGGKKRRRPSGSDEDDEDLDGSTDEDSFYDRTGKVGAKGRSSRRRGGPGAAGTAGAGEVAEDASSLYGKVEALKEERTNIEEQLKAEMAKPKVAIERDQASTSFDGTSTAGNGTTAGDSLDAFMMGVDAAIESDRAAALRRDLAEVGSKIERTEKLLKLADPDGYYKPGSKAAEAAVQRARRTLQIEQQRREAEERQRREAAASKAAAAAAAAFIPEQEIDEQEEGIPKSEKLTEIDARQKQKVAISTKQQLDINVHHIPGASGDPNGEESGGLQVFQRPIAAPIGPATTPAAAVGSPQQSAYEKRRAGIAASLQAVKSQGTQGGSTVPQGTAPRTASDAATEKVLADLAVLQHAKRGYTAEVEMGSGMVVQGEGVEAHNEEQRKEEDGAWVPPENQTGDGRTALNEKLGY